MDKVYQEMYQIIKNWLYDIKWGLRIEYNQDVIDRENIMAQNLEVYEYMCSSLQNEKQIIDQIISKGIAITKNNQYIINVENIQRFLTSSAVVPMARSIYQEIKMIDKKDNIPSK